MTIKYSEWVSAGVKEAHEYWKSEYESYPSGGRHQMAVNNMEKLLGSYFFEHSWMQLEKRAAKSKHKDDAYNFVLFALKVSAFGIPAWVKETKKERELSCDNALNSIANLVKLMSRYELDPPGNEFIHEGSLKVFLAMGNFEEFLFQNSLSEIAEEHISDDLRYIRTFAKKVTNLRLSDVLKQLEAEIKHISGFPNVCPRPTTSKPERDYFAYCLAQYFAREVNLPLYPHVATMTAIIFDDIGFDPKQAKVAHRSWLEIFESNPAG